MGLEIERKFLVESMAFKGLAFESKRIIQGYLNDDPRRTVRIRISNELAYITIKGSSNVSGMSRYEWEKQIDISEAKQLLDLCLPGVIDKTRWLVKAGKHTFEVDEFLGDNEGLIVAEIELKDELETFERPSWLGREVTGISKYYNASMINKPFNTWEPGSEM